MLKIIVISLFVANLLLLGLQRSKPVVREDAVVKAAVADSSNLPTIHLFSELIEDQGLMLGNRQCFSLGPFHSVEEKDEVRQRLLQVSATLSERETRALVEQGYWVFLPPFKSMLEANQTQIMIHAEGVKDVRVLFEGEMEKGVSLGYFLRQGNAIRRQKDMQQRGYPALIRVRRHTEPRYWLDYEQIPGSGLIALDMQNRANDFMQRSMPCPEQVALAPVSNGMTQAPLLPEGNDLQAESTVEIINNIDVEVLPVEDVEAESGTANEPESGKG